VSDSHLNVDVRDDLIVVTEEGLYAIYSKPEGGHGPPRPRGAA
jgi:hypothetical protein